MRVWRPWRHCLRGAHEAAGQNAARAGARVPTCASACLGGGGGGGLQEEAYVYRKHKEHKIGLDSFVVFTVEE